ncbi:MAG: hypothetical protein WAU95_15385 [Anaerolineae bacterium]
MTDREFLQARLKTLQSLTGTSAVLKGSGVSGLQNKLHAAWELEQRLLARILTEPGDLAQTISAWQTRTQAFVAKYPDREGWTDAQGHAWNASQVLALLTDVQQRLDALKQPDEFEEEGE